MSTTTRPLTSAANVYATSAFWGRLWRTSGFQFVALAISAHVIYGLQPQAGASADTLIAFYDGNRTRLLIAAVVAGMAVLYLLWFGAALRTALANAGQDGWGAAVTASSVAVAGQLLLLIAVHATLAIGGSGNHAHTSGLNEFTSPLFVVSSFPRAMLIMAGTFGLWRAGLISNSSFTVGVAAVVLVLLGGTTWISGGVWAPGGTYSRVVSPFIGTVWVLFVSRILLSQPRGTRTQW